MPVFKYRESPDSPWKKIRYKVSSLASEIMTSSGNTVQQEIDTIKEEALSGVPDWAKQPEKPSYTAAEVGAVPSDGFVPASNPNLLDNPWFTINQRSIFSCTSGFFADRWGVAYNPHNATIAIQNGYVVSRNASDVFIRQGIEDFDSLVGQTVTMSVMLWDGLIRSGSVVVSPTGDSEISFPEFNLFVRAEDKAFYARFNYDGSAAKAFKLEYGSVSTLANDHAPDYAMELLKCQRYYLPNVAQFCSGLTYQGENFADISIPTPIRMRDGTSLQFTDLNNIFFDGESASITNARVEHIYSNRVIIRVTTGTMFSSYLPCTVGAAVISLIANS